MAFVKWVQGFASPFWDWVFVHVTMLGEVPVFLVVAAIVMWVVRKEWGYRLAFAYVLSGLVAFGLKEMFRVPRPFEVDGTIRVLRAETISGYSFPSGHAMRAAALFGSWMVGMRRRWGYVVGVTLFCLVGLSRIYVGAHTPQDVIAGLLLGLGCVWATGWLLRRSWVAHLLVLVPAVAGLWVFHSLAYERAVGAAFGCVVGYLVETRWIRFHTRAEWWMQVLKVVVGFAGLAGLYVLLGRVLPETATGEFATYALLVSWITVGAPACFKGLGRIGRRR
jgi:membrane-associated phospholipid phosphatase